MIRTSAGVPPAAWLYGALGALPFIGGAAAPWVVGAELAAGATRGMLLYGAVVLSFLGGIQWGLAAAQDDADLQRLGLGVAPSLIAWGAALLGGEQGLLVLAAGFALMLAVDLAIPRWGWAPGWYARLRLPLSLVVLFCLLVATVAP